MRVVVRVRVWVVISWRALVEVEKFMRRLFILEGCYYGGLGVKRRRVTVACAHTPRQAQVSRTALPTIPPTGIVAECA